jgi:DNA-binding FrmR family transcriptional regulator
MESNQLKKLYDKVNFLKFSLSNTVDPINVIHIEGQIKEVKKQIEDIENGGEVEEQTTAGSSGAFEAPEIILKKHLYKKSDTKEGEFTEATDASSSGAFDVPAFGKNPKGGRRDPLKIDGVKSIAKSRAVTDPKWPKFGGPGGTYVKIKDKCKKFPYCNQGDIRAIEPLREAIDSTAKKYGLSSDEVEKMILMEIKEIFIKDETSRNK